MHIITIVRHFNALEFFNWPLLTFTLKRNNSKHDLK